MKQATIILAAVLLLALCGISFAAGSVTQTLALNANGSGGTLTFAFTGDSADGTVPATASSSDNTAAIKGMYVTRAITNPGGTAPTDNYDITITDADGIDLMGGTLANRDQTNSEQVVPKVDTVNNLYGPVQITGTITLNITNTSVNSATGTVVLVLAR